jgi:hypothetical protein
MVLRRHDDSNRFQNIMVLTWNTPTANLLQTEDRPDPGTNRCWPLERHNSSCNHAARDFVSGPGHGEEHSPM